MSAQISDRRTVVDYKHSYPINIRLGMIGALLVNIALFAFMPREFKVNAYKPTKEVEMMKLTEENLQVEDLVQPPPDVKPAVPVEAESEEEVEAATTAETDFAEVYENIEETVDVPVVPFWKVEKKPQPKNNPKPVYPAQARAQELEGQVLVEALVGADGRVEEVKLIKSSGHSILDEAALRTARQWTFSPAEQRGQAVKVPVTIPFNFTLRN